jgi:hypothetical protein
MNRKRRATIIFLVALSAATLWVCYLIARPFLKPVFFALVLAIFFHPLHARLRKLVRNRNAAALLSTFPAPRISINSGGSAAGTACDEVDWPTAFAPATQKMIATASSRTGGANSRFVVRDDFTAIIPFSIRTRFIIA